MKSKQQQLQQQQNQSQHSPIESGHNADSDESKMARQKLASHQQQQQQHHDPENESKLQKFLNSSNHPPPLPIVSNNNHHHNSDSTTTTTLDSNDNNKNNQKMPSDFVANGHLNIGSSSLLSHKIVSSVMSAAAASSESGKKAANDCDSDASEKLNGMQIASSTPLNAIKSIAEPFTSNTDANAEEKPAIKPKALHHQISLGNHVVAVPPRKPISSVAPTSIKPKVGLVAPINNNNNNTQSADSPRPALPPKPAKNNNNTLANSSNDDNNNNHTALNETDNVIAYNEINLPIKAKPLTIKKQPMSEQPKLRSANVSAKSIQYTASRRIEMPPAFLFPEVVTAELRDNTCNDDNNISSGLNQSSIISKLINGAINLTNNTTTDSNGNHDSGSVTSSNDETDKSGTPVHDEKITVVESVVKRKRNLTGDDVKAKLARRVSFDPLALLLDASLEGELELVRKTAMQVPNPSAANDEGITALHNAICAGHLEIVK